VRIVILLRCACAEGAVHEHQPEVAWHMLAIYEAAWPETKSVPMLQATKRCAGGIVEAIHHWTV